MGCHQSRGVATVFPSADRRRSSFAPSSSSRGPSPPATRLTSLSRRPQKDLRAVYSARAMDKGAAGGDTCPGRDRSFSFPRPLEESSPLGGGSVVVQTSGATSKVAQREADAAPVRGQGQEEAEGRSSHSSEEDHRGELFFPRINTEQELGSLLRDEDEDEGENKGESVGWEAGGFLDLSSLALPGAAAGAGENENENESQKEPPGGGLGVLSTRLVPPPPPAAAAAVDAAAAGRRMPPPLPLPVSLSQRTVATAVGPPSSGFWSYRSPRRRSHFSSTSLASRAGGEVRPGAACPRRHDHREELADPALPRRQGAGLDDEVAREGGRKNVGGWQHQHHHEQQRDQGASSQTCPTSPVRQQANKDKGGGRKGGENGGHNGEGEEEEEEEEEDGDDSLRRRGSGTRKRVRFGGDVEGTGSGSADSTPRSLSWVQRRRQWMMWSPSPLPGDTADLLSSGSTTSPPAAASAGAGAAPSGNENPSQKKTEGGSQGILLHRPPPRRLVVTPASALSLFPGSPATSPSSPATSLPGASVGGLLSPGGADSIKHTALRRASASGASPYPPSRFRRLSNHTNSSYSSSQGNTPRRRTAAEPLATALGRQRDFTSVVTKMERNGVMAVMRHLQGASEGALEGMESAPCSPKSSSVPSPPSARGLRSCPTTPRLSSAAVDGWVPPRLQSSVSALSTLGSGGPTAEKLVLGLLASDRDGAAADGSLQQQLLGCSEFSSEGASDALTEAGDQSSVLEGRESGDPMYAEQLAPGENLASWHGATTTTTSSSSKKKSGARRPVSRVSLQLSRSMSSTTTTSFVRRPTEELVAVMGRISRREYVHQWLSREGNVHECPLFV